MKTGEKKRGVYIVIFLIIITLFLVSVASAGVLDWIKEITGKVTEQTVTLNITVGVPQIITVFNNSINISDGPNENSQTYTVVNFSIYAPAGVGEVNHSTAKVNYSRVGEDTRENVSCTMIQADGDYANYTCNITMWWWDATGSWNVTAYIEDNNTNSAQNYSTTFYVGSTTAFVMSPDILTWTAVGAGSTNKTANTYVLMNNTGNDPIATSSIEINSSNLRGEGNPALALWAGNFSVSNSTGGTPPAECGGTTMVRNTFTGVGGANLTEGNYTINDGTGQEQLYFCLNLAGTELTTQSYSTANETEWPWVVKIS